MSKEVKTPFVDDSISEKMGHVGKQISNMSGAEFAGFVALAPLVPAAIATTFCFLAPITIVASILDKAR